MTNKAHLPAAKAYDGLSRFRKWLLRRGRPLSLGFHREPGWSADLEVHLFWCAEHNGPAKSHAHGYSEVLVCPECTAREGRAVLAQAS